MMIPRFLLIKHPRQHHGRTYIGVKEAQLAIILMRRHQVLIISFPLLRSLMFSLSLWETVVLQEAMGRMRWTCCVMVHVISTKAEEGLGVVR